MMLAYRLLRLVENHSEALAAGLLEKTQNSPLLPGYRNVPPGELEQRVYEIYRHLADWLLGKTELDVEKRYTEIGAKRARQERAPKSAYLGNYPNQEKPLGLPETRGGSGPSRGDLRRTRSRGIAGSIL